MNQNCFLGLKTEAISFPVFQDKFLNNHRDNTPNTSVNNVDPPNYVDPILEDMETKKKTENALFDSYPVFTETSQFAIKKADNMILIMPIVKRFLKKLRNASAFREISQLTLANFSLMTDSSFFYETNYKSNRKKSRFFFFENRCKSFFSHFLCVFTVFSALITSLFCLRFLNKHRFIVHPYQNIKLLWDILHLCIILLWFFYIPLLLAFDDSRELELTAVIFSTMFFSLDILLNFNTAYFKNGILQRKRSKIFKNYLRKRLFYDIITFAPFGIKIILVFMGLEESYFLLHVMKFVFFFKITTYKSIYNRILEKFLLEEKFQNILSLFKVLFVSLLVAHLFACAWYLTSRISLEYYSESWLIKLDLMQNSWKIRYLYSLYWAFITMMTVGYGDISPQNVNEVIVCLVSVVLGCAVYAYNINSIGIILQDMNKENAAFNHKINIMNQFMIRKNIHRDLQMRIREYLRFIWKEENAQNLDEEKKIIDLLSNSLKEELLSEAYGGVLKKHPMFFANFSEKTLRKIVYFIKDVKLFPEEKVFIKNEEEDNSIFFVMKGKVELFLDSNGSELMIKKLGVGEYFGEIAFFTGKPRLLSARSKDFTTLFSINREDFIRVLQKNPEDFEKFCMIKDQIQLYGSYLPLKTRCFCCEKMGHIAGECSLIHYLPDKEKIIKTFTYYLDQERNSNFIRKFRRNNALKSKITLENSCVKVRANNQKEKEAKKLFGEINTNSSSEEEEEEEENEFSELETGEKLKENGVLKGMEPIFQEFTSNESILPSEHDLEINTSLKNIKIAEELQLGYKKKFEENKKIRTHNRKILTEVTKRNESPEKIERFEKSSVNFEVNFLEEMQEKHLFDNRREKKNDSQVSISRLPVLSSNDNIKIVKAGKKESDFKMKHSSMINVNNENKLQISMTNAENKFHESFEAVHNFKNYFLTSNCKAIIQEFNKKKKT